MLAGLSSDAFLAEKRGLPSSSKETTAIFLHPGERGLRFWTPTVEPETYRLSNTIGQGSRVH